MANNNDTLKQFKVGSDTICGLGSYHKSLPHDHLGEVCPQAFQTFVTACAGDGSGFAGVPKGSGDAAPLVNPQGGLAADQLVHRPTTYSMPPAPTVLSETTAAEMTELYWMACLRDVPFDQLRSGTQDGATADAAAAELDWAFKKAVADSADAGHLMLGIDVPGSRTTLSAITRNNVFRLGLPGDEAGPMLSQFFVRPIAFGTQTIDARQRPYKSKVECLTDFPSWLHAQRNGRDCDGRSYSDANEKNDLAYEDQPKYISTMRDLARFVNKDALHQAYFNAALVLLSGKAKWTPGNPYSDCGRLTSREAGFGVLGGPHILALVSEVATRALKVVWNQKWQVNLRLRPEAYGGLVHVQNKGIDGTKRPYGLPGWGFDDKGRQDSP